MGKVFKTIEISTEFDQDIRVFPTPQWDGVEIEFKEADEKYKGITLYLDENTAQQLMDEISNMLNYIKQNK